MKILSWNVALNTQKITGRLDKACKGRLENIIARILYEKADIVALSEVSRNSKNGKILEAALSKERYICEYATSRYSNDPDDKVRTNWITEFIAYKGDCGNVVEYNKMPQNDSFCGRNWIGITVNNHSIFNGGLRILSVHVPNKNNPKRKAFFDAIYAESEKNDAAIILGDFNAFFSNDISINKQVSDCELKKILDNGWVDAWEKYNGEGCRYTYCVKSKAGKNDYCVRLDYAFFSPALSKYLDENNMTVSVKHLHDVREQSLSDHSALLIEILQN